MLAVQHVRSLHYTRSVSSKAVLYSIGPIVNSAVPHTLKIYLKGIYDIKYSYYNKKVKKFLKLKNKLGILGGKPTWIDRRRGKNQIIQTLSFWCLSRASFDDWGEVCWIPGSVSSE